ncbi:MAG: GTP 3',8-cyclase MoaA [Planctomycetota bacterium]|jgi:cyclic pyranopterin phosphate synthase
MIDGCGREIDHLRLSLTDHCNLACRYCVPRGARPSGQMIEADFAFEVVRWLSQRHGIRHLRLTGGEPLLHPELIRLIERLSGLSALHEITLTTNGQALGQLAQALAAAGLARVNASLDTLNPDRFAAVTRGGNIAHTLAGIEAAVEAGLTPVKINVVAQRGLNDDELVDLAEWGLSRGCVVRFLEVMPIGPLAHVADRHLVPASEILERLAERFELRPIPHSLGQPAVDYAARSRALHGVIGLIAPTTRPFCSRCRRLRVTSHGSLVACVHDAQRFDLTEFWNGRALEVDCADAALRAAVHGKPEVGPGAQSLTMLSLGG